VTESGTSASLARPRPWRAWDPRGGQLPEAEAAQLEPLLIVAFQARARGDGGLRSLTEIMKRYRRYRPLVVTQRDSSFTREWRDLGFEVLVWENFDPGPAEAGQFVSRVRRWSRRADLATRQNLRLRRLVQERGIRVVHCNDLHALFHAGVGARLAGAKVVFNLRSTQGVAGPKWGHAMQLADRTVVLSEEMRQHVLRYATPPRCLRPTPVDVISSIVDFSRMRPPSLGERQRLRKELGLQNGEFSVGVVGMADPRKQQLELLEYLRLHLQELPPRVRFHLVGELDVSGSDYGQRCEALIWAAPAEFRERVRLVGYEADVRRWYQALDCVLMPSAHEGLARVMIESLACHCPVVSFAVCSAREVLESTGAGLVAERGDYPGLLRAVGELSNNAGLVERLGEAGARYAVQTFGAERVVTAYEQLYSTLAPPLHSAAGTERR
jgi:glycosyltransferase involved in cell wall biosynthesis